MPCRTDTSPTATAIWTPTSATRQIESLTCADQLSFKVSSRRSTALDAGLTKLHTVCVRTSVHDVGSPSDHISLREVLHTRFVCSLFGILISTVFLDNDGRFGISRKCL